MRIAEAHSLTGRTNYSFRTTPGSEVRFQGGVAYVTKETDMPHVLAQPGLKVTVYPERIDWLADWLNAAPGPMGVQAELNLPDDWTAEVRDGKYVMLKGGLTLEERYPTEPVEEAVVPALPLAGWQPVSIPAGGTEVLTPVKRGRPPKVKAE